MLPHVSLRRGARLVREADPRIWGRGPDPDPPKGTSASTESQDPSARFRPVGPGGCRGDRALAFARDLPRAEINLLDGGHFLLESRLAEVVALIRPFLEEHLAGAASFARLAL